jgi:hypothetical protein
MKHRDNPQALLLKWVNFHTAQHYYLNKSERRTRELTKAPTHAGDDDAEMLVTRKTRIFLMIT